MAEQIESCDHESDRVLARSPGREILATSRTGSKPGPRGVQGTERNQTGQERRAQGGDFVEILAIAAVDVAVAEGSGTARTEERRDRRDDAHGFGPGPTGGHDLAVNPPPGKSCTPRTSPTKATCASTAPSLPAQDVPEETAALRPITRRTGSSTTATSSQVEARVARVVTGFMAVPRTLRSDL